ncbi:hypothetical protein G5I_06107 [Acromyrmex echinatior]|uniref:Uncharacterized protein n=1 Tax=Acromyrmex echinatior TaxID=103372 RepID=F4WK64_ACREC|nr:hypothetical protein G5I_06107 [Acromyrmex echinatior]
MVARQDWHVPRLMFGDLVFRLETGGLSGCLSDGRRGMMPSADEGWENRIAQQSRPQPNRMLDIFGLSRDNHEIKWTKESFDEGLRTNNAENHRLLKEGQQYISEEKNFLALGLLEEEEDREKPFYEDAQSFNIDIAPGSAAGPTEEGSPCPRYPLLQPVNKAPPPLSLLAGIVIPCNGPCVDSFAHIVVVLVGRRGVLALRYDSRAAERVSREFKKKGQDSF